MSNIDFSKLRALIEVDDTFNILKEKYKEIEVDLLSWRENPTCSCGKRVHEFFNKTCEDQNEMDFLNNMFELDKVKEKIEIEKQKASQLPPNMTDYRGKVFTVGKTDEDWWNFWQKIIQDKAAYRTFSLLEKEDYLKIYFL
jgi:beta-xylosidase